MTIQQLQYVLEIARCGSASRAAKKSVPVPAKPEQRHKKTWNRSWASRSLSGLLPE